MKPDDIVVNLVALHGGELVGRTRLQKGAYLLHRCGANFDLSFVYHHYGPYSFDLADGCVDARAEKRIEIEEHTGRYGIKYAIFKNDGNIESPVFLGALPAVKARHLLNKMKKVSDIVLELAATIVFLRGNDDDIDQAIAKTKARKPLKATDDRLKKALALIRDLGLYEEAVSMRPS